jgi:hypothetical protein
MENLKVMKLKKLQKNTQRGYLPDFLIIGAQKSGTSWLADKLAQHPEVFMAEKEIHYFDKDFNLKRGIAWYRSHFSGVRNEKAVGEKTPDYLWAHGRGVEGHLPEVHENIYRTLPDVKLIIVLRNPVERAISAVNHMIRSGRISPLHNINDLLIGNKRHLVDGYGVIDKGRYYRQIQAYLEYFKRSQMLLLIFEEDIVRDPSAGLRNVCDFIGIDHNFEFAEKDKKSNIFLGSRLTLLINYYLPFLKPVTVHIDWMRPGKKARPDRPALQELYRMYEEENAKLFNFLGRKVDAWKISEC